MNDADNLEIGEQGMRRQIVDQFNRSLTRSLWYHRHRLDFNHSRVVGRYSTKQVSCNRRAKIGGADERLHNVLREDESWQVVLDVVVGHVDVLKSQWNVGRRDGSNPPIRLTREDLLFVRRSRHNLNLVSLDIGRSSLDRRDLVGSFGRFLNLGLRCDSQRATIIKRKGREERTIC